jgi:hypothetical protein
LTCKQVAAHVQQGDPISLLLFFLKKGGGIMNEEKGIKRKLSTGIRNVKLGQKTEKVGKRGEFRKTRKIYIEKNVVKKKQERERRKIRNS